MDKVAIIILNWNSYRYTYDCLKSLEGLSYKDFKVFLVDNNSADNSFQNLKMDYETNIFSSDIEFIQTGSNLGFAGGNNVGVKLAKKQHFKYVWLLNNDTTVHKDSLHYLLNTINSGNKTGIVGSKIYYYDTDLIWFAGGRLNEYTGNAWHVGIREKDNERFNQLKEVDYITGCSLLFKMDLVDSIGYMMEDYFLYYEETDWNLKAASKGWKIVYVPESIVYHKVSVSSGGEKNIAPYVDYYYLRNAYIMIKRNGTLFKRLTAFINLLYKFLKKHIKIIIRNLDRKSERRLYLYLSLKDALAEKMGKHPDI